MSVGASSSSSTSFRASSFAGPSLLGQSRRGLIDARCRGRVAAWPIRRRRSWPEPTPSTLSSSSSCSSTSLNFLKIFLPRLNQMMNCQQESMEGYIVACRSQYLQNIDNAIVTVLFRLRIYASISPLLLRFRFRRRLQHVSFRCLGLFAPPTHSGWTDKRIIFILIK